MIITLSTYCLILLDSFLGKQQMQAERLKVDLQMKNVVWKCPIAQTSFVLLNTSLILKNAL